MTPPLRPDPYGEDEPIRARLRRRFLSQYGMGSEDPMDPVSRISPEAPRMGSGLYRESEIGNAAIDRSPETARRQGRGQAIIDAALAGLSGLDPQQGGAAGFIGSAVQAAGRTRGVYDRLTREAPEQTEVPDQLLRYAFGEEAAPSEYDLYQRDPDAYARFKAAGRAPPKAGEQYVLRMTKDGSYEWLPKPGVAGSVVDTGVDAPPPMPVIIPGAVGPDNAPLALFRGEGNVARPIATPGGSVVKPSAGQQDDVAAIDTSLKSLDDIDAALKGNEKAFSIGRQIAANIPFVNSLGRRIVTRRDAESDPDFVKARASVAILNSTIRKLQSGAAVTPYEGAVLESFLGDEWKDDAKSIAIKTAGVRRWVQNKRKSATDTRKIGGDSAPDEKGNPY